MTEVSQGLTARYSTQAVFSGVGPARVHYTECDTAGALPLDAQIGYQFGQPSGINFSTPAATYSGLIPSGLPDQPIVIQGSSRGAADFGPAVIYHSDVHSGGLRQSSLSIPHPEAMQAHYSGSGAALAAQVRAEVSGAHFPGYRYSPSPEVYGEQRVSRHVQTQHSFGAPYVIPSGSVHMPQVPVQGGTYISARGLGTGAIASPVRITGEFAEHARSIAAGYAHGAHHHLLGAASNSTTHVGQAAPMEVGPRRFSQPRRASVPRRVSLPHVLSGAAPVTTHVASKSVLPSPSNQTASRKSPLAPEDPLPATYQIGGNTMVFTVDGAPVRRLSPGGQRVTAPATARAATTMPPSPARLPTATKVKPLATASMQPVRDGQASSALPPSIVPETSVSSTQLENTYGWKEDALGSYECETFPQPGDDPGFGELSHSSSGERTERQTPDHLRSLWLMAHRDLALIGYGQMVVYCPYQSLKLKMKRMFVESALPSPQRVNLVVMHGPNQVTIPVPSSAASGAAVLVHMRLDVQSVVKILVTDAKGGLLSNISIDVPRMIYKRIARCRGKLSEPLEGQEGSTLRASTMVEFSCEPSPAAGITHTLSTAPFASVVEDKPLAAPSIRKFDQVALRFGGVRLLKSLEPEPPVAVRISVVSCTQEVVSVTVPIVPEEQESSEQTLGAAIEGPEVKISLAKALEGLQFVASEVPGEIIGVGSFNFNSLIESRKSYFQGDLPLEVDDEDDIVGQLRTQITLIATPASSKTDNDNNVEAVAESARRTMEKIVQNEVPVGLAKLRMNKVVAEIPQVQAKKQMHTVLTGIPQGRARLAMTQVLQEIPRVKARRAMSAVLAEIPQARAKLTVLSNIMEVERLRFQKGQIAVLEDIKNSPYRRAYLKLMKGLVDHVGEFHNKKKCPEKELKRAKTSPMKTAELGFGIGAFSDDDASGSEAHSEPRVTGVKSRLSHDEESSEKDVELRDACVSCDNEVDSVGPEGVTTTGAGVDEQEIETRGACSGGATGALELEAEGSPSKEAELLGETSGETGSVNIAPQPEHPSDSAEAITHTGSATVDSETAIVQPLAGSSLSSSEGTGPHQADEALADEANVKATANGPPVRAKSKSHKKRSNKKKESKNNSP